MTIKRMKCYKSDKFNLSLFLAKLVNSKNDPLGSYKSENGKFQHVAPEIQAYSVKKINESHTKLY